MLRTGQGTPELDVELARLNQAVDDAIAARKAWMDAHMPDYALCQVGDEIYDLNTGRQLGWVVGLYRYHEDDQRFDRSMAIDYKFTRDHGQCRFIDNTSSKPGLYIGTAEDLAAKLEREALWARERVNKQRAAP